MDRIIDEMKRLGLTEYEAKAYLSLLENNPLNGYALSKNSGIPRSRIYEVLDGLVKKQLAFEHREGKTVTYTPLEPGLLSRKLRKDFEETMESVDAYATSLYRAGGKNREPKILKGREGILMMLQVLIREAKGRIAFSMWDEEVKALKDELDRAKDRGVMLRGIYFGSDNPYEEVVSHRRIERYLAEKDDRYLIVVVDDRHSVSGVISRDDQAQVTWSDDPGIIDINEDFIAHDVMINRYSNSLEGKERITFENTLDTMRKDYYGFSDKVYDSFPIPEE